MVKNPRDIVLAYVSENLLLGAPTAIGDDDSLMDAGILDSTAAMELVAFLDQAFGVRLSNDEISVDNLDSISRICSLIARKRAA